MGNNISDVRTILQENSDWVDWQTNVLPKRNSVENIFQWTCGRPTTLHDRARKCDDEDYEDRDYNVATLANNLSQAFHYEIYNNDEVDGDVYIDGKSAEEVISSLNLGNLLESGSIFTNSDWFAFEDKRIDNDHSTNSISSESHNIEGREAVNLRVDHDVMVEEDEDLTDMVTSEPPEIKPTLDESDLKETKFIHEWVGGSSNLFDSPHTTRSSDTTDSSRCSLPNGELQVEFQARSANNKPYEMDGSQISADGPVHTDGGSPVSKNLDSDANPSQSAVIT